MDGRGRSVLPRLWDGSGPRGTGEARAIQGRTTGVQRCGRAPTRNTLKSRVASAPVSGTGHAGRQAAEESATGRPGTAKLLYNESHKRHIGGHNPRCPFLCSEDAVRSRHSIIAQCRDAAASFPGPSTTTKPRIACSSTTRVAAGPERVQYSPTALQPDQPDQIALCSGMLQGNGA